MILLRLPDRAAFQKLAFSRECREISRDRQTGPNAVVLPLVKGID